MTVVGVDGCKAGWFAIRVEDDWANDPTADVFPSVRSLLSAWGDASLVLIDIPIGLPDTERPRRRVDDEARSLLGGTRSRSVFSAPGRAATERLLSAGPDSYATCSEANFAELQLRLSTQAYGIMPKIAEVDQLLLSDPVARSTIREVHPELCFWGLNRRRPMMHRKSDAAGVAERLELLAGLLPWADSIFEGTLKKYRRSSVQRDDILDAMAAAATAIPVHPSLGDMLSVPHEPERDSRGLPMEMLYRPPR